MNTDLRTKAVAQLDQIVAIVATPGGYSRLSVPQRKFLLAAALCVVVPADRKVKDCELERLENLLRTKLQVPREVIAEARALAERQFDTDSHIDAIARAMGELLGTGDRGVIVGHLWDIALCDHELHDSEERLIYRIADMAGVPRKHVAEKLARAAAQS